MSTKKLISDLPFNEDAEKAVLGSALLSNEALYSILASLEEEDFFVIKNRKIFRAIASLFSKKTAVDTLTVTEELINMKELEAVGGVEYLQQCCDAMVSLSSLDFYINIVNDQAVLRKLIVAARKIDSDYAEKQIDDINDFILSSESSIKEATARRRISSFKKADNLAKELVTRMNTPIVVGEDNCTGLTTGYASLNRITGGLHAGDMIIIAARPSVGKTALALNIAYKAASHTNKPVAIFSLEMSCEQLMDRMLGIASYVKLGDIKTRRFMSDRDRAKINATIGELSQLPIYIDDTSSIKLMDILANSRKLQAEHPDLGLIIVDYLGLVTNESKGKDSRQEEVRKISLALKALAKELKVPVIAVSQLSRNTEQRGDNKRPMLSDLRDSGSIEQDADVVMLLYREDYYKNQRGENKQLGDKKHNDMNNAERFEAMKKANEMNKGQTLAGDASLVEVNVAKNRNGQTGTAQLFFYKDFGRFDQPSKEWIEQMKAIDEGNQ